MLSAPRAPHSTSAGIAALNAQLLEEHGIELEVRIGFETGEVVATAADARQRLVTGEVVGIAARLEQAAGSDEIFVGELAGRLIDHAATLEPLGELSIKGRKEPVRAYRLLELADAPPAFERRLDAPLVGRKRELAALRRGLKRATDSGSVSVAVVSGPPGVGKSRLAAELRGARRTLLRSGAAASRTATASRTGRCARSPSRRSWARSATPCSRRSTRTRLRRRPRSPGSSGSSASRSRPTSRWFSSSTTSSGRNRPSSSSSSYSQTEARGESSWFCLARDELFEDRPSFLEDRAKRRAHGARCALAEDTDALLDGLGGAILESDQRARISETAEGNPFFVEQLLALAFEGGLAEQTLPETVQALLAARLDRLGPGERAVLERGSIVIHGFTHDDVTTLLEPAAAPTVAAHLESLVARGFLRPAEENAFRFRHLIVQEAVYRSAPKRLRAELHERFADRLDQTAADLAELDEFVGYHLERAFELRSELGEFDRRTERLAEDGGHRLGEAGIRALKRGDMPATVNLLERATSLLPRAGLRSRLLAELSIALLASGDAEKAKLVLAEGISGAEQSRDRPSELRGRIELAYIRSDTEPGETTDGLLDIAAEAIPVFESVEDHRSLGRAWLYVGFAEGSVRGRNEARLDAAERALGHYKRCAWPTETSVGEIAAALYFGPTPVDRAIERCEQLVQEEPSHAAREANINAFLSGLLAQRGDFERARAVLESTRSFFWDLGQRTSVTSCDAMRGDIELLAGDAQAAEAILRTACDDFRSLQMSDLWQRRRATLQKPSGCRVSSWRPTNGRGKASRWLRPTTWVPRLCGDR